MKYTHEKSMDLLQAFKTRFFVGKDGADLPSQIKCLIKLALTNLYNCKDEAPSLQHYR